MTFCVANFSSSISSSCQCLHIWHLSCSYRGISVTFISIRIIMHTFTVFIGGKILNRLPVTIRRCPSATTLFLIASVNTLRYISHISFPSICFIYKFLRRIRPPRAFHNLFLSAFVASESRGKRNCFGSWHHPKHRGLALCLPYFNFSPFM